MYDPIALVRPSAVLIATRRPLIVSLVAELLQQHGTHRLPGCDQVEQPWPKAPNSPSIPLFPETDGQQYRARILYFENCNGPLHFFFPDPPTPPLILSLLNPHPNPPPTRKRKHKPVAMCMQMLRTTSSDSPSDSWSKECPGISVVYHPNHRGGNGMV